MEGRHELGGCVGIHQPSADEGGERQSQIAEHWFDDRADRLVAVVEGDEEVPLGANGGTMKLCRNLGNQFLSIVDTWSMIFPLAPRANGTPS